MAWREEIRRRLAEANLDPAREEEIAQELEQHLEDRYAERRAMGHSDSAARQAAIDELREDIRMREELTRVERAPSSLPPAGTPGGRWSIVDRWQDVRYAARMLKRTPGLTAVAVLTLAVGIGGTVAIVSAVYAVLYRPLAVADGHRLVVPVSVNAGRGILRGSVPFADYADWRNERDVFEQVALFSPTQMDLGGGEAPERIEGLQVSRRVFRRHESAPAGRTSPGSRGSRG